MSYRLAKYSPSHKDQVCALRSRVFGGEHSITKRYLEWKYEQNPYLKDLYYYVALYGNSVVGMQGMFGSEWCLGSSRDTLILPCTAEFAVDAAHRSRGLGQQLANYKLEDMAKNGFKYVINLSANESSRGINRILASRRLATYRIFRQISPARPWSRSYRKIRRVFGVNRHRVPHRTFDQWAARISGPVSGSPEPRIAAMSQLVAQNAANSLAHHVRDATFYRWRLSNPMSSYRFIYSDGRELLDGFFVLQHNNGSGMTSIIDWETSTPGRWVELLNAAISSRCFPLQIASPVFTDWQLREMQRLGFAEVISMNASRDQRAGMFITATSAKYSEQFDSDIGESLKPGGFEFRMICSDAF
ncbi:MAG: GNAT family N-acetyltransferase [Woeseiaceae bacterium]|jgi:GNAT superfamily N-acetyltransferase